MWYVITVFPESSGSVYTRSADGASSLTSVGGPPAGPEEQAVNRKDIVAIMSIFNIEGRVSQPALAVNTRCVD